MSDDAIDSMEAGRREANEWTVLPGGKEKEEDDGDILGGSATNDDNDDGGDGASLPSNRVITVTHPDVKKYLKDANPLHSACKGGAPLDVIKYLVEEADGIKGKELLGKANNRGSYPLHLACLKGAPLDVIKYLVEEADGEKGKELLGKPNKYGRYPLHLACRGGASLDVIKYLVEEADGDNGKELLGKANKGGKYPLHCACQGGAPLDVIKYLVEEADGDKGKEPLGKADEDGMYPLHLACYGGASLNVIKYLVEEADGDKGKELLGKADRNGRYPLHWACGGGASLNVIKYLVEEADGDKGKELLGKADRNGRYPLHWACQCHAPLDVIKYLIQMNPDPLQHKDDSGLSALDHMDNDTLQATCGTHQLGSVADKSFLNDNMEVNCQSTIWNETDKVVYVIVSDRTIETLKSTSLSTNMSPSPTIAGNTLASGSAGIVDTKKDMGPTPPPQITPILPCESRTFNLESTYYYVTCYTKNASDRNVFHEVNKRVKGTDNYKIEPHCLKNFLFVAELENLFGKEIFLLSVPVPVSTMDTTTPPTADDVGQGGSSQRGTDPPAADIVGHCGSSQRGTDPGAVQGGERQGEDEDDDTSGGNNNNNRGWVTRFLRFVKFWKKKATIRNKTDTVVYVIVSDRTIGEVKSTNLSAELSPTIAGSSLGKTGWSHTTQHNKGPTPPQMTTIPPFKSHTFNLENTYYYLTYCTKSSENGKNFMDFHGMNLRWRGKDDYTIESTDVVHYVSRVKDDGMPLMTMLGLV